MDSDVDVTKEPIGTYFCMSPRRSKKHAAWVSDAAVKTNDNTWKVTKTGHYISNAHLSDVIRMYHGTYNWSFS